jgi:hypothetical protein
VARKKKGPPFLVKEVCLKCPHELTPWPNQTFCIVMLMLPDPGFNEAKLDIPEECLFRLEHTVAWEKP